jgi:hypothetical protein
MVLSLSIFTLYYKVYDASTRRFVQIVITISGLLEFLGDYCTFISGIARELPILTGSLEI